MSSSLASQNRFAYLGNDEDGDDKPNVPVKTVDKAASRTTKRNVEPQAPAAPVRGTGGNRRGASGSEGAFRDRAAGSDRNYGRSTDEAPRGGARGGAGARVRGGRGARNPRSGEDRHTTRSVAHSGTDKQAAQGWGAVEGEAELKDEQAGEAIAQSEKKAALADDGAEEVAEPEDKSISYEAYLAQLAEKKLALEDGGLKVREANEGSKLDKKWASAKALEKEDEAVYFAGVGGKAKRERERKTKQTVDFDPRIVEPERTRGGSGPRGGAPRGGARGGRGGRGGERGGAERGGSDRGRGGNFRGAPRGGGGRENAAPINTRDESAFPSLGGK